MKKVTLTILAILLLALVTPIALQAQTAVACEEEYVVQAGDTLATIAAETLNDPLLAYPALLVLANAAPDDAYANIDDPNVIEAGWTVCIPAEEDLPDLLAQAGPVIQAIARAAGIEPPPPFIETLWVLVEYGDPEEPTVVEPGPVVTNNSASHQVSIQGALAGVTWVLAGTLPDTRITAQFDGATISGSSGCNSYSGSYSSTRAAGPSNNISVGELSTTRQACEEAVMEQEQAYLAALSAAQSYTIEGNMLTIAYAGGTLVFQAEPRQ